MVAKWKNDRVRVAHENEIEQPEERKPGCGYSRRGDFVVSCGRSRLPSLLTLLIPGKWSLPAWRRAARLAIGLHVA